MQHAVTKKNKMQVSTFTLSDESINSYGLKVLTAGIDLSAFENNPVMLMEHDRTMLVGRWTNIRKEEGRLLADAEFDTDDELALKLQKKVEKGFLKGVSMGLQIQKLGIETPEDGGEDVPVVLKSLLLESSLCAIPSNRNSLKLYDADGQELTEDELKLSLSNVLQKHHKNHIKMKLNTRVMQFLGLTDGYTEETLNTALETAQQRVEQAEQTIAALAQAEIDRLIDGAVSAGKIKGEQATHFKTLAQKDLEGVKNILNQMQAPAKPTDSVKSDGNDKTKLSQRSNWDFDKWRKEDPKGLLSLKHDQPEQYAALVAGSTIKQNL